MRTLSARDRRALVLGGAAVVLGLALTQGAPRWLASFEDLRDEAYRQRRGLLDATALIEAIPALRDSLAGRKLRFEVERSGLIEDRVPAAAAARLGSLVSLAATSAGLALQSIDLQPDSSTERALRRPAVRGEARGDISGLGQFLLLIESGPPLMRVTTLSVVQADPVGGRDRFEELRISFVVEGSSLASAAGDRP